MSENEANQRVPLVVYVTEDEREYVNTQADKMGLRRSALLYFLLKRLTHNFTRDLNQELFEEVMQ